MSDIIDRCIDAIAKNSRGLSDHEIARDISVGARATWGRDVRAVLDEIGGADAIERLAKERAALEEEGFASFEEVLSQLKAAETALGTAVIERDAAEAARDEALAEIKKMEHAFFERSVAHHTELNEARAAVAKMPLLWEIAHQTWHALDAGEDRDDEGHVIPRSNMDDLAAAFDKISPLDDDIHEAMHDALAALEKNLSSPPKEPTDV